MPLADGLRSRHGKVRGSVPWPGAGRPGCEGQEQANVSTSGTHVAGTVGSTTYGVAKNVSLIAVKICTSGGSCPDAAILCGIDYVTQQKQASPSIPMVANMLIGYRYDQIMNDAVTNSIAAGVFYAVPAGNNYGADACNYSPASTPDAMTVGATTSSDARASYSNIGPCLDIFAPGSSILSTYNSSDTATTTMTGTSMASAHVAGAAALVLDEFPTYIPAEVTHELLCRATCGVVSNPGVGSPNILLNTLPYMWMHWTQTVDDSDIANVNFGGPSYWWWEIWGYGINNQMHHTWNFDLPEGTQNYVEWYFDVPQIDHYKVEVFIPRDYATTTNALYWVHEGVSWSGPYPVNQDNYDDQWVTLDGSIQILQGSGTVYLGDCTGEPTATRLVGVDAARMSRLCCYEVND